MNIKENNQLIARFMGYEYFPYNPEDKDPNRVHGWRKPSNGHLKIPEWYLCRKHADLPYYNDWNHLMKVVDKIESLGYCVDFYKNDNPIPYSCLILLDYKIKLQITLQAKSRKEAVYEACVKFIDWYKHQ